MFSGLELTPAYLFTSMVVSSVGFAVFLYGKKQLRVPQLVAGIALMAIPAFVGDPLVLSASSAATMFGLWAALRVGA